MAYIWDWLFVAFESSRWADGTWDRVRSHEFVICFICPAPPRCRAQTAADVIECRSVNIYPGKQRMALGGVAQSVATLTEQQILASASAPGVMFRGRGCNPVHLCFTWSFEPKQLKKNRGGPGRFGCRTGSYILWTKACGDRNELELLEWSPLQWFHPTEFPAKFHSGCRHAIDHIDLSADLNS